MAIARIATFPGGTKEQYEDLGQLMGEGVVDQPERRVLAEAERNGCRAEAGGRGSRREGL